MTSQLSEKQIHDRMTVTRFNKKAGYDITAWGRNMKRKNLERVQDIGVHYVLDSDLEIFAAEHKLEIVKCTTCNASYVEMKIGTLALTVFSRPENLRNMHGNVIEAEAV